MTVNTSKPPERTATARELARESAREIGCGCGARPGYTCDGKGGMHLSRYAAARRDGLITETQMGAVLALADVITAATIIRAGAR